MVDLVRQLRAAWMTQPLGVRDTLPKEAADRIEMLEDCVRQLIMLYGRRGGDADEFLPYSQQEREMSLAMVLMNEGRF